jgi:hypothetical protein
MTLPLARLPRLALPFLALAALPAVAATPKKPAPINWKNGTPTSVTMTDKGYAPRRLVMRSGGQYVLRLHNPSDRAHTFAAKEFFAQARVSPADQAWIPENEVVLKPGQSATLRLIAPTTPRALYTFKSTRIADAASNFKGEIVVR